MPNCPYEILAIQKNADTQQIKAAFRSKAKQTHPDKPGGNAKKFIEAERAYSMLSDRAKRKRFDELAVALKELFAGMKIQFKVTRK